MSADNYWGIRRHGVGFTYMMGFDSDEDWPTVRIVPRPIFMTVEEARRAAEDDESTEYGVRVHPECYEGEEQDSSPDGGIPEERLGFGEELEQLLNGHSMENRSGTPDFILAEYLIQCLSAYNNALVARAAWRGELTELPALTSLNMPPEEVARHHDYPTSDPGRPMDEVINRSLGRAERHTEAGLS